MGDGYKPRDTRLDRTVAIQVLRDVVALDPETQARFARGARAISSLDHPDVCALHDVGEDTPAETRAATSCTRYEAWIRHPSGCIAGSRRLNVGRQAIAIRHLAGNESSATNVASDSPPNRRSVRLKLDAT